MAKYGEDLPQMQPEPLDSGAATTPEAHIVLKTAIMRCGGCGAKVKTSLHLDLVAP